MKTANAKKSIPQKFVCVLCRRLSATIYSGYEIHMDGGGKTVRAAAAAFNIKMCISTHIRFERPRIKSRDVRLDTCVCEIERYSWIVWSIFIIITVR